MQPERPGLSGRTRAWLLALGLIAGVLLAYQSAWNAGFVWDDDEYVITNPLLTAPNGLWRIWFSLDSPSQYFPLVYTTFRIERALWGLAPSGYHWVNILFHCANAVLLWRLLVRLRIPGAWLAAAVFALHPVQVESVAWITELKNVQMGFFFLLSLLAWTRFTEEGAERRWGIYALSLGFYALALCSKTTACTLPAVLLLITWLRGERVGRRKLVEIVPFVALGIGMGLLTMWWERYHQGTYGKSFAIGLPERALIAGRAVWFYLGKLLWPAKLTFSYPRWDISASDPADYLGLIALCALGGVAWFARRVVGPSAWVALAFFVATLGPMLGFIMLYTFRYSFVADHYQYLACVSPIALASAGIAKLCDRFFERRPFAAPGLCALLLLVLAALTWRQGKTYRDVETLWTATLARNPASAAAYANLGWLRSEQGRTDEAIVMYREALRIDPSLPEIHHNLGKILAQQGHSQAAIGHYREALRLDPTYADVHSDLGVVLFQLGSREEAFAQFGEALRINPGHGDARYNLGIALFQLGRTEEATSQFRQAVQLNPYDADTHINLAQALMQTGQVGEAIYHLHQALELRPADVAILRTLAAAYARAGQFQNAVQVVRGALQLVQSDANLSAELRREITLYEAGRPFEEVR